MLKFQSNYGQHWEHLWSKILCSSEIEDDATYSLFLLYINIRIMPTMIRTARIPSTIPTTTSDSCVFVEASVGAKIC